MSDGFKSGLCLGHSRTSPALSLSYFCVVLAVCSRLLSCWKVKTGFYSNMKLRIQASMFSLGSIRPENLVYNRLSPLGTTCLTADLSNFTRLFTDYKIGMKLG